MKCCNPDCDAPATMMPRVKNHALDGKDVIATIGSTEARQRALAHCCDHYAELSCCDGCTDYAVQQVCEARRIEDAAEVPIMLIPRSPVLLKALADSTPAADSRAGTATSH